MNAILKSLNEAFGVSRKEQASKKTKLQVEQLDERIMPAITFGSYGSGTWAYDHNTNDWRRITAERATVMDEGADGTLYASYDSFGTYRYDYGANSWQRLTQEEATALSAADDNTMFGSYAGFGTYEYDGNWALRTNWESTELAAVANDRFFATFSRDRGTWKWDDGWTHMTNWDVIDMDASSGGVLYVSFTGGGTWRHNGSWSKLTNADAQSIAVANNSKFYATFVTGTYRYENGWHFISYSVANDISADRWTPAVASFVSGGDDFGRGERGTYELDGSLNRIAGAQADELG